MKISELKKTLKESIREVFREEMKDILLEAVRSPKQQVNESSNTGFNNYQTSQTTEGTSTKSKEQLREEYKNILGGTGNFNSSQVSQPLQVTSTDTASPNGKLPSGEVSLDQISNFLPKR